MPGSASQLAGGLILEMCHPETGAELWVGAWVQKASNPAALQKMANDADKSVRKILNNYPPAKQ